MNFSLQQLLIASIPPFLWAFMTFFLAKANRTMNAYTSLFLFELVGIPIMLIMLPFISPEAKSNLFLIAGLGIWQTTALLLYFYALRVGQMAIVGTIIETNIIITVFLSVFFIHESFYFLKFIAIIVVLLGVIFLGFHFDEIKKTKRMKLLAGVYPTLIAAFITGVYFFFVGISSRMNGWYTTALGIRIMIPVTIIVWYLLQRKSLTSLFKNVAWKWIVLAAIFDVIAFSVFNYALTRYEISYISVVNAGAPLISTILAVTFLKEKLTVFQLIGFFLVIAGIIILNIA